MKIHPFSLEYWFRDYAFTVPLMLSSSGVEEFSFGELRQLLSLSQEELDRIVLTDSLSEGNLDLRKAIAQRWGQGEPEKVFVTHGSSEAIFLVMNALLEKNDEVVILTPCYKALYSIPEAIGCQVKPWSLQFSQDFRPDIEQAASLITARTRMVVVNFPNNPTGATISESQLTRLLEMVSDVGAYLLWDGAFTELTYSGAPLPDPCFTYERTISLGTFSKAYGLPGLRIGWGFATPDVIARCVQLRDYITIYLSPLIELIAKRAVEESQKLLHIRLRQAQENLHMLTEWIAEHRKFVKWVPPQGGVSVFLQLPGIPDVEAFCRRLAEQRGVFVVPGVCFDYPEHVRIGFGGNTEHFKEGLACLSKHLFSESKRRNEL